MKWLIFFAMCLLVSGIHVSFGAKLRVKPQVWEVDPDQITQVLGLKSENSDEFTQDDQMLAEENETEDDTSAHFDEEEDVGLCVEPRHCANRDGQGLIEPRKSRCNTPKVFCPLDDLEDYPLCGISKVNLIRDRILSAGNSKSSFAEWPWVAMIMERQGNEEYYLCNGALIDSRHLITVAHCFDNSQVEDIVIRLGEHNINSDNEPLPYLDVEAEIIVRHPNYTSRNLHNDLAVIRLKHEVPQTDHIGPICLPNPIEVRKFQLASGNARCITMGWGLASKGKKGSFSDVAKKVILPLVDQDRCEHLLRKTKLGKRFRLHSSFLCAGGEEGHDSCFGDGGSPLMYNQDDGSFTLMGLVSWGIGCGQSNVPGLYTNVVDFVDFIDECKRFMQDEVRRLN